MPKKSVSSKKEHTKKKPEKKRNVFVAGTKVSKKRVPKKKKKNTRQSSTRLSTKQLSAIAILSAIPSKYGTISDVAKQVGVSRALIYKWSESEIYAKELEKRIDKNYKSFSAKIRNAHIKFALKGNAQLIALFYKHAEKWVEKTEQKLDLDGNVNFYIPKNGRD